LNGTAENFRVSHTTHIDSALFEPMEDAMHRWFRPFFLSFIAAFVFAGCSSSRLTRQNAGQVLKPVATLPEREASQLPVNLLIRIENVADAASSYRNYVVLKINGKEVAPDEPENNMKANYKYSLSLQPGVYNVEAKYHVVGFWKERVYKIETDEPVKILPGKRTVLSIRLDKDNQGFPLTKANMFTLRYQDLNAGALVGSAPIANNPGFNSSDQIKNQPAEPAVIERNDARPPVNPNGDFPRTKLQINTVPVGADIYVDDRFVGQSPVRLMVNGAEGHIIQVAKKGFSEYLRVLNPEDLREKREMQIIVRLEKEE